MTFAKVLQFEALLFTYGMLAIVAWKALTSGINMRGLLMDKTPTGQVSPERVQLLISTFVLAIEYVRKAGAMEGTSFPQIEPGWLYLFGGSSLIYSMRKAVERYRATKI